jgi:DNA-binding HxlR family transcriptional regulator
METVEHPVAGPENECPIVFLLGFLSTRWALPVLFMLHQAKGPVRFGQLQRSVGRVTQKELTKTLREFEARGFCTRKVYAEVPPRVEYSLTPLGESLRGPLDSLAGWVRDYGDQVLGCESHSNRFKQN